MGELKRELDANVELAATASKMIKPNQELLNLLLEGSELLDGKPFEGQIEILAQKEINRIQVFANSFYNVRGNLAKVRNNPLGTEESSKTGWFKSSNSLFFPNVEFENFNTTLKILSNSIVALNDFLKKNKIPQKSPQRLFCVTLVQQLHPLLANLDSLQDKKHPFQTGAQNIIQIKNDLTKIILTISNHSIFGKLIKAK